MKKMSDVIMAAFELVVSRDGDIETVDGSCATCGIGEIIRLDEAVAHYFEVGSDDVNLRDVDLILKKAKEIDANQAIITKQSEQIKVLREALEMFRPEIYYNQNGEEVDAGGNFTIYSDGDADNEAMQKVHEALESTEDGEL